MLRGLNAIIVLIMTFSCLSGCIGNDEIEITDTEIDEGWRPFSVVAPIDTE